jgi:DNA repair protein RadC
MTSDANESLDSTRDRSSGNAPLDSARDKQDETAGHRERLRKKFLKSGLQGFHDYEIVELLLTLGRTRQDTKPQAKEALKRFGSLRGVLEAPIEELQQIDGIGPQSALAIKLVQEVAREFLKEKIIDRDAYRSSQDVYEYLRHSMRDLKKEIFKVLYLNSQNQINEIEDLFEGTVNSTVVSPREIIEGAIKHNAVSLIFVHNHPSGNPDPSQADKDLTRDLVYAGSIMNMKVLDHIIIGNDRYFSFAGAGLIEQAELDFLNLKMSGVSEAGRKPYKTSRLPLESQP